MDDLDLHTWQIKRMGRFKKPTARSTKHALQRTRSSPQRTRRESAPARLEANDLLAPWKMMWISQEMMDVFARGPKNPGLRQTMLKLRLTSEKM